MDMIAHDDPTVKLRITRQSLNKAINQATAKAKTDRQHRRITDACRWLNQFAGAAWTIHTPYVLVKSATSERVYRVDIATGHCGCRSHTGCWHAALSFILRSAAQPVEQPIDFSQDWRPTEPDWSASAAWRTGVN